MSLKFLMAHLFQHYQFLLVQIARTAKKTTVPIIQVIALIIAVDYTILPQLKINSRSKALQAKTAKFYGIITTTIKHRFSIQL